MILQLLFSFLLFTTAIWSNETNSNIQAPSLVEYMNGGIPRVHDTVSIISGSWVDQGLHAVDKAIVEPYRVGHTYSSNSLEEGTLAHGWEFFHPSEIHVHKGINETILTSYESGGAVFQFKSLDYGKSFKPILEKTGFFHISSISNPTRLLPSRTTFKFKNKMLFISLGDGRERIYKKFYTRKFVDEIGYREEKYRLIKEITEARISKEYTYNKKGELTQIKTLSSKGNTIGSVSFKLDGKKSVICQLTDGSKIEFKFKKISRKDYLPFRVVSSIHIPGKRDQYFDYCDSSHKNHVKRIEKKSFSGGKTIRAKFYPDSKKTTVQNHPYILGQGKHRDFVKSRVRELYTKTLPGESQDQLSHVFYYKRKGEHKKAKVIEADGYQSTYYWNALSKRLRWHVKQNTNGKRLLQEKFTWLTDTKKEGWLSSRALFDEDKNMLLIKEFEYDSKGNVIQEMLRGVVSHATVAPLQYNDKTYQWKSGGEAIRTLASYDTQGRKISETDSIGCRVEYTYDTNRGLITKKLLFNPSGKIIGRFFYSYDDESPVLIEEMQDDGTNPSIENMDGVTGRTIKQYNLRKKTPLWGAVQKEEHYIWTPSVGKVFVSSLENTFDDKGHIIKKSLLGSDHSSLKETVFAYDKFGRLVHTNYPDGSYEKRSYHPSTGELESVSTPQGTEHYSYDFQGRIISKRDQFPDGSETQTHMTYNLSGRVCTCVDAFGYTSKTIKDNLGRVIEEEFPETLVEGRVVRPIVRYSYRGRTTRKTHSNGVVEELELNLFGKPLKVVSPINGVIEYRYDARGREVEKDDKQGYIIATEYDDLDRVISVKESIAGAPFQEIIQKKYNFFGLIEETTRGVTTRYSYDQFGRLSCEENQDRVTGKSSYTYTNYDAFGRKNEVIEETLGTKTLLKYDLSDRVVEEKTVSLSDAIFARTRKEYDTRGNLVLQAVLVDNSGKEAITKFEYGAYNKLSKTYDPEGNPTLFSYRFQVLGVGGLFYTVEKTTYPNGASVESWKNGTGVVTLVQQYDFLNRLISKRTTDADIVGNPIRVFDVPINPKTGEECGQTSVTAFEYDAVGNCVAMIRGFGTSDARISSYKYDAYSRKTHERKPSGVEIATTYDVQGRVTTITSSDGTISYAYSYDLMGNPTLIEDKVHGKTIQRTYSGSGDIVQETLTNSTLINYMLDALGRAVEISSSAFSPIQIEYQSGFLKKLQYKNHFFDYHERTCLGVPLSVNYNDQISSSFSYDIQGRKIGCKIQKTNDNRVFFEEARTTFSPMGELLFRTIKVGDQENRSEYFCYDLLGQLTSDNGTPYQFDSLQRAISLRGKTQSFSVLHEITNSLIKVDIDGRRIQDEHGRGYQYDAFDRLTCLTHADGTQVHYYYDGLSRRVERVSAGKEEHFLFVGDNEVGSQEKEEHGELTLTSFRILGEGLGAEIGAALLIEIEGNSYFPFHDLSGHIRGLISSDSSTSCIESYNYTAFGPKDHPESPLSPWTFSSKRREPNTELFIFGRRLYDSENIVWTTLDPLGFTVGPNLYAYVKNNPLTLIDLYGLYDQNTDRTSFISRCFNCVRDFFSNIFSSSSAPDYQAPTREESATLSDRISDYNANYSHPPFLMCQNEIIGEKDYRPSCILTASPRNEDFFAANRGQTLKPGSVIALWGGMLTSSYTMAKRGHNVLNLFSDIRGVILGHNSTESVVKDGMNATKNSLGYTTEDVDRLAADLKDWCYKAHSYNIQAKINSHAHSESGGIAYQVFRRLEKDPICRNYIGKEYSYGTGAVNAGVRNFITPCDPIPCLNIFKFGLEMLKGFPNTTFIDCTLQSPMKAHGFDNPSYQRAFYENIYMDLKSSN